MPATTTSLEPPEPVALPSTETPPTAISPVHVDPWTAFRNQAAHVQVLWLAVAGCLAALYFPSFIPLVETWWKNPDYSHGFLVIPASLYFANIAWQRSVANHEPTLAHTRTEIATGVVEILLGFVLHLVSLGFNVLILDVLSLICMVRGAILLIGGATYYRAFAFPVLFLIFLAPLPPVMHQWLALFMQQSVALASTLVLDLLGVPVYREGYLMQVPGYTMEVGAACSGLRSMTAILALAVAIGFLMNGSRWYAWTLALLALPIAGLANCVRVIVTGLIMINLGREYADGVYHQLEGMVLEVVAAVILVAVAFGLAKFDRQAQPASTTPTT